MKKLILIMALIFVGCSEQHKTKIKDNSSLEIDTIEIHGKKHEIILRTEASGYQGYGGMMHSPECWCTSNQSLICE